MIDLTDKLYHHFFALKMHCAEVARMSGTST
jgi:hypothetical protein